MTPRSPALQDFIDLTRKGLEARSGSAPAAVNVIGEIFGCLETVATRAADVIPTRLPACDHIGPVLADDEQNHIEIAALVRAFAGVERSLAWTRRGRSERRPDHFSEHHANATIIGRGGIEARDDVWIGASVMAPGTRYPDHSHPPEEVYLVLSGGEWRQNQGDWHAPGVGGLVHNPPGIVHSMRSGSGPLLALWCLFLGWSGSSVADPLQL